MSNLFGEWSNDIDWDSVSREGKRLSQAARRNLILVSAICAIGGSFGAGVGLVGNYTPRVTYCDTRTRPCTKVETTLDQTPLDIETKFIPGYGLRRTAASIFGLLLFGAGVLAVAKAEEEAEEEEPQIQLDEQLKIKRLELEANAQLQNLENLAEIQVETHRQELIEAQAELMLERNPSLVEQYAPKTPEPEVSQVEVEQPLLIEESEPEQVEPEPEVKKIPPGIELMLDSDLREIVDAGILNLVGAQGSGKTTTACMLLRYRVWKGHKLIIVNPHKRKTMYRGLESHLLRASEFYGVGVGDEARAQSLLDGLERILELISTRYDQYQNMLESDYDHFPVTILLEESAEYEGLLSVFNKPADKQTGDPGFSAKKYLTQFWKKFFIATRKANCFGLRTLQFDSNTMNGTEGMAELIKSQGACTLTQYSIPDGSCDGGWRSTGEGEIKIPNMRDAEGKPIESKPVTVPTWFDYKKVLDPSDFRDLKPAIQSKGESLNEVEPEPLVISHESVAIDQQPIPNLQSPVPNPQSPEIDPDELLRQHIDRILEGFERSLVQSGGAGRGGDSGDNHPELDKTENQPEPEEPETPAQVLTGETGEAGEEKRYTPMQLTKVEVIAAVSQMRSAGMSQTKIIESLWQVQKSRSGWSQAYREFIKELGL